MKTFKIIGVRPLKGCNKHIIKNLKSDTFYTFYNNYEFKGHSCKYPWLIFVV